ncbi:unnamed protein product [Peniophora sp. CBMAI 1063]|nr:unnamed protein product [Peniophora sp. CBMAI 1063]
MAYDDLPEEVVAGLFSEGIEDDSDSDDEDIARSTEPVTSQSYYARRRIGESSRKQQEHLRKLELTGVRGMYVDDIGWKHSSARPDPERTPAMAKQEASIYRALKRRRALLRSTDAARFPQNYCAYVDGLLVKSQTMPHNTTLPHRKRCLVAGYAQEIELWRQGGASYRAARQDGILIFKGNGVNRHTSRRLFDL